MDVDLPTPGDVTIVGGGFSGTMVALQLARSNISSVLVDAGQEIGRGTAYSTTSPHHLLNVRAANMSAFPDQPYDFASYIASAGEGPDSFAKRSVYGDYLTSALQRAVKDGLVRLVHRRVVRACASPLGWQVTLDDGEKLSSQRLVLALGNNAPLALELRGEVRNDDIIEPFWTPHAEVRLERAAANDEPVLIVGTGLTMVDALLSLDALGHRGPITAVSRRGLLPLMHIAGGSAKLSPPRLEDVPGALSRIVRWLRLRAQAEHDWQFAIDALRPITQAIWRRMDVDSRKRFLRHARPFWDVHRHRLAPAIGSRLNELRMQGRLSVLRGRVEHAQARGDEYSVRIALRGGGEKVEVQAGLIINCTGPLSSLSNSGDPLIIQMVGDGLMEADELDLGPKIDESDRLTGLRNAYAIGPMTRGRHWEITAVPELRIKAADIAKSISRAISADAVEMV